MAAQKAYSEQHPNVTFTNNLLSTDALLPSYEAAGQAKEGPTIMYLWGGIYTMDAVWKGWIVPISDMVGMEEAGHYINKAEATWDDKILVGRLVSATLLPNRLQQGSLYRRRA